jgi:hypothetical protein
MYTKTLLLLSLAAAALAEPIPQATTDLDAFPTSFDSASLESQLASLTAGLSIYSDMPTLPSSIESVLATAIPTGVEDEDPCATTEPAWLKNLPGDVKDALSSYETELASWYSEHSAELGGTDTFTGAIPTGDSSFCTGGSQGGAITPEATAASGGPAGKTTAAPDSSSTAKGAAASSTNSPDAAARPTGAIAAGVAGVVGMVGVMLAL